MVHVWLMRSRLLRLLAVGFMVPVVLLVQTGTAQAADDVGRWATGRTSTEFGGFAGYTAYGTVECDVSAGRRVTDNSLMMGADCWGPSDVSPGYSQPGEQGAYVRMWFVGPGCDGISTETILGESDRNKLWRVGGKTQTFAVGGEGCVPTSVCVRHDDSKRSTHASNGGDCGPISVPLEGAICGDLAMKRPELLKVPFIRYNANGRYHWYEQDVAFDLTNNGTTPVAVRGHVVIQREPNAEGRKGSLPWSGTIPTARSYHAAHTIPAGETVTFTIPVPLMDQIRSNVVIDEDNFEPIKIIGAGIGRTPTSGTVATWNLAPSTPEGLPVHAMVGRNSAADCMAYWGDKLWDDGQPGGADEPAGPVDLEPEVPAEWEDEEPDESEWWQALWGLLKAIIQRLGNIAEAVLGLPAKIASAILGGLQTLFVPDEFPDWDGVGIDIPSGWVPSMPSLGAGACGPVNMPAMDFGMAGSVAGVSFVNTCVAPWTHVRTVTYYGLMGLAFIVVAKRVFQAALGGLGMGVESSGGGDDL